MPGSLSGAEANLLFARPQMLRLAQDGGKEFGGVGVVDEPAAVVEQMANGDPVGVVAGGGQQLVEQRVDQPCDRAVEIDQPAFPEAEDGGGNEGLCVAGDPERRVERHRPASLFVGHARGRGPGPLKALARGVECQRDPLLADKVDKLFPVQSMSPAATRPHHDSRVSLSGGAGEA